MIKIKTLIGSVTALAMMAAAAAPAAARPYWRGGGYYGHHHHRGGGDTFGKILLGAVIGGCLLYTSPSPRDS